uniref:Surfeit locus protein 6 homolog n=1 Tax=Phallusia mammillata TaxID=59560 RepID=A0A6F9DUR4_9ASCI|nr:surfeit locus protein 6 homolog [Phallusia mammillata]
MSDLAQDAQSFQHFFQNVARLVPIARKPILFNEETNGDEGLGPELTLDSKLKRKDPSSKKKTLKVSQKKHKVNLMHNKHKKISPNFIPLPTKPKTETLKATQPLKHNGEVNGIEKDGKLVFSKFDFGVSDQPKEKRKRKEKKRKKLEICIKKATTVQEKMEEMKQNDPEMAEEMVENDSWKKAVSRAKGVKVKDNVALLKKSIKKMDEKKKKSKKQWKERTEKVQEKQKRKQDRRMQNIKKKNVSKGKFKHRRPQGF